VGGRVSRQLLPLGEGRIERCVHFVDDHLALFLAASYYWFLLHLCLWHLCRDTLTGVLFGWFLDCLLSLLSFLSLLDMLYPVDILHSYSLSDLS
jgi:hypothetical protein